MGNIVSKILNILFTLPGIIIALSFHEMSHGYTAHLLGDDTAHYQGRITLNPMKHFDLFGFLCLIFVGIGWGKPVPVNARNFKKPKRDMALTSLAGPASNFLLAFVFSFLLAIIYKFSDKSAISSISRALSGIGISGEGKIGIAAIIFYIVFYAVMINISLGVFNLLPVPPLDGSNILFSFLPNRIVIKILPYEKYVHLILLLLLFTGILSTPLARVNNFIANAFISFAEGVIG